MLTEKLYFKYWGKAEQVPDDKSPHYHLLPYHCLDVAAVGKVLLTNNQSLLEFFVQHSGFDEKTFTAITLYFLALHDVGKFSESFQGLREDLLYQLSGLGKSKVYDQRHDSLGFFLWRKHLDEDFCASYVQDQDTIWQWQAFFEIWALAFTGHHGQPPKGCDRDISRYFLPENIAAAEEFSKFCQKMFLKDNSFSSQHDFTAWIGQMKCLSWWLAGFAVLCDWLGSNSNFFKPHKTPVRLEDYWNKTALPAAKKIVQKTDFLPVSVSKQKQLPELFSYIKQATPLQEAAETIQLGQGQHLFILEDVTGAGKTEAAFMLLHRLMAANKAEGAYVALPTMATANAMYIRTGDVYRKFYADDRTPSLILAHGARHLMDGFVESVLPDTSTNTEHKLDEPTAAISCNAWLADNRKKALLAHIGVGTIDQALLAILKSRHQSMRLLGLRNKVLIVDEVHACDAYMHQLLQTLLTFHAAAGGSAILLSATLPYTMRQQLLAAYARGMGKPAPILENDGYPLLSRLCPEDLYEQQVATREEVKRNLSFSFLDNDRQAIDLIIEQANAGQCVAWVRNTVADAMESYDTLVALIPAEKITLFHARFALGDRLTIEEEVLSLFGKESTAEDRQGRVLIATQVIEQSLDLDFDWLISDLAPIDLLIQRAGRLRRHSRDSNGNTISSADKRGEPTLYLLSPDPQQDADANWYGSLFPKSVKIYPDHGRLWLTARYLMDKKKLRIPADMRAAIEHVYDEQSEEKIPAELLLQSRDAETDSMVQRSMARMNRVQFDDGYSMPDHDWWDETVTPTRIGEPSITLRLAKWENEKLVPWAGAIRNGWSLSEVNVRQHLVAKEAIPRDKNLKAAIVEVKEQWPGRQQSFCLLMPMIKTDDWNWQGNAVDRDGEEVMIRYSEDFGLEFCG